ncbi:MAG TPA: plastocyanin/azurin family copper-binding protein, partial [Ignavibacteriaceae bacterium]|nr:plastocyanin/azurin family copper-binding protein [Ignavibacteriaceae bacterium]
MKKYVLSVLISLTMISFVPAETLNVNVVDYAFTPADIVCSIGDTVVWTYDPLALAPHTTTSTSVPAGASTWDYTFAGPGDTYTYVIEVAGDYTYQCNFHPAMMQGTIRAGYSLPMVENFEYPEGDTLRNYGG